MPMTLVRAARTRGSQVMFTLAPSTHACGVPIMVDSARKDFLAQCKLPDAEFYADSFTTAADLAK